MGAALPALRRARRRRCGIVGRSVSSAPGRHRGCGEHGHSQGRRRGRPNVGKSTFINTLLGEPRLVVNEEPGTTRDAIDTLVHYKKADYLFIDTAGIRRRGRIDPGVERYSVARAMRALGRADLAVLILDGVEGVTEQDTKIAGLALRGGRACVLLVNKWDQRADDPDAKAKYEAELRRRFAFVSWAPVLYGSALEFKTVAGVFPVINRALKAFGHRVPTAQLNRIFQDAIATHPLPIRKGKPVKSAYITQVAAKPPTFVLFCNHPEEIGDRKSTRLNSSHGYISYAVFCLKKKKNT